MDFPLIIIPAFDLEGEARQARNAKYFVASLFRTLFSGRILVLRNTEMPLFKVERSNLTEIFYGADFSCQTCADRKILESRALMDLRQWLEPDSDSWVMMADPATLALRNIDHLLPSTRAYGDFTPHLPEILILETSAEEEKGYPAVFAVRSSLAVDLGKALARIKAGAMNAAEEATAWYDLKSNLSLRKSPFESGETYAPSPLKVDWTALTNCALGSFPHWEEASQRTIMRSLFLGQSLGNEMTILLHLLEN